MREREREREIIMQRNERANERANKRANKRERARARSKLHAYMRCTHTHTNERVRTHGCRYSCLQWCKCIRQEQRMRGLRVGLPSWPLSSMCLSVG